MITGMLQPHILASEPAAAKDTYINKYVEVSGKLGTIDSDLKYISLMSATDEWDFNGIHCEIRNNDQKEIVKTLLEQKYSYAMIAKKFNTTSSIVNDIAATSMKSAAADLAMRTGISKKEAYKRLLESGDK